jgi:hypothetical protein
MDKSKAAKWLWNARRSTVICKMLATVLLGIIGVGAVILAKNNEEWALQIMSVQVILLGIIYFISNEWIEYQLTRAGGQRTEEVIRLQDEISKLKEENNKLKSQPSKHR